MVFGVLIENVVDHLHGINETALHSSHSVPGFPAVDADANGTGQALTAQIDRELDAEKRQDLIRRAEAIMETDPPLLPVSWERINEVWYSYVKGLNPSEYFGIFDIVRQDTVWLDKS